MKKIEQGKIEVFTSKGDAINKLMQMQGFCQSKLSNNNSIEFFCTKKGKFAISNPPTPLVSRENSTKLFGNIIEDDNKTYITFYTTYSNANNITKIIYLIIMVVSTILSFFVDKTVPRIILILCFLLFGYMLFITVKEKDNSPVDSNILISELKRRVDAINNWDK